MVVRRGSLEDVEAMVRIINAAFEKERWFIDAPRTDPDDVRAHLQQGEFLVGEEDGALVGCVYLEVDGPRGYFGMLAVDPALQGGGRGRRLIDAVEERARERGCAFMDIRIADLREELLSYYRRLSYLETGETQPFTDSVAHLLKRPCHFVTLRKPLA
jgi:ribosomal protein S18 acetylase RimI-like enzyme